MNPNELQSLNNILNSIVTLSSEFVYYIEDESERQRLWKDIEVVKNYIKSET